jgi:hypothetical protein
LCSSLEINQGEIKMADSHGGKRQGAGRKVGAITTRTRELADKALSQGISPLDYMLGILRNETETQANRMWAAEKAAPYLHPKLAAVEHSGEVGHTHSVTDLTDEQLAAIATGGGTRAAKAAQG